MFMPKNDIKSCFQAQNYKERPTEFESSILTTYEILGKLFNISVPGFLVDKIRIIKETTGDGVLKKKKEVICKSIWESASYTGRAQGHTEVITLLC